MKQENLEQNFTTEELQDIPPGELEELNSFFEENYDRLRRSVANIIPWDKTQDIVQLAYLVLRSRAPLNIHTSMRGAVNRCVKNVAIKHKQRRMSNKASIEQNSDGELNFLDKLNHGEASDYTSHDLGEIEDPEKALINEEINKKRKQTLKKVISELPPKEKLLFIQYGLQNKSAEYCVNELEFFKGMSKSYISTKFGRIKRKIKQKVQEALS